MDLQSPQLLLLLQMTDSMFPSGAFVHSEGLETYVQRGIIHDVSTLTEFLKTRLLHMSAQQDMVALHCAMDFYHRGDEASLLSLDMRLSAMKTAKETREASTRTGRQTLRTMLALQYDPLLMSFQESIQLNQAQGHFALVFGIICAAMNIEKRAALVAYGYSQLSSQVSSSIKLMRLGQTAAQSVLIALQSTIYEAAEIALQRCTEEMQSFAPALDIYAMKHEYLFRRLFNS